MSETPELAALLRSWRARVQPDEVGSPFARGSRKTPGLRREEVAWLAGVSYPADRELSDMITALRGSHPEFAHLWDLSTVTHHGNERKTIDHPDVGELELDCDVLSVHGADLRIIVFTAAPGSAAADKLHLLRVLGSEDMSALTPTRAR